MRRLTLIALIVGCLFSIKTTSAATIKCPLRLNAAYKYIGNNTVFYINKNCAKQAFPNSTVFFSYFKSWKQINAVTKKTLEKIPKDKNYLVTKKTSTPITTVTQKTTPQPATQPTGCSQAFPTCGNNHICENNECILKTGCQYHNPDCQTNKQCVSNQCTSKMTWQQKINALVYTNYEKSIDNEKNLVLTDGNYKVILPDSTAENYGKWKLNSLKNCSKKIKDFLGNDPYVGTQIVDSSKIDENRQISACCGQSPEYAIENYSGSAFFKENAFGEQTYWKNENADYNLCPGGHEEIHRFVHLTKIPSWANEGLATYFEKQQQSSNVACNKNSFFAVPFEGGEKREIPFRNVIKNFYDKPTSYSYYTASCLWDYIKNNYGDDKVKEIISNLYNISNATNTKFIKDAVVPAVGSDIWNYLKNMGVTPENDY